MKKRRWLWMLVLGGWGAALAADPGAYVAGLEALAAGDFRRATQELDRAVAGAADDAAGLRARGVARTLAEQFPGALADLQRARRLDPNDREAQLWLAAAYRMSGDPAAGAQLFSFHSSVPKDYADLVYNQMALAYWQSRAAAARTRHLFPEAARLYAQRHLASGPAAHAFVGARLQAALDRGDWPAALADLRVLRRTAPDDAALRGAWARCLLGLGDAWHARGEFTRTLCVQPEWAEGYLGRARAAALLGDPRRVAADRATAAALGRAATIDDRVPAGDAPMEIQDALAVHRQFNATCARYDELYQDRIRVLTEAARHDERNAAWPEGLARFLYNQRVVPTVWNGPRAVAQLRPQSQAEQAQELQRAFDAADAALRLDRRNVNAIATKAWLYLTFGNPPQAERLADEGLGLEPRSLRLLRLKERIVADRAAALAGQASALRAGRTESHTEQRSDGTYRVTTHYPPTAAELAQAAALEAEAAANRRQAERLRAAAGQVETVTLPALLKARAFDEAALCDPDRAEVLRGQAGLARRRGDARGAQAYELLAAPLEHTTAAAQLQTAWAAVVRTAWQPAAEALAAAAQTDPSDARVPAYRALVAAGRGDPATAARQRRAALALEEARMRLMGLNLLTLDDVALLMAVRRQQAEALLAAGDAAGALVAFDLNAQIETRFDESARTGRAPTALLPDPAGDPNTIPEAPTLASLLAWSQLGAGRALLALGKPDAALQRDRTVLAYAQAWPATAEGRETLTLPCGWAQLGLVEAAIAAQDYELASRMVMDQHLVAWGLPRELEQRRQALQQQLRDTRMRQEERQREADAQLTPRQLQARQLQINIAQFQQQRDDIARELQRPDLDDRTRQALRNSLAELDRMIASYQATLHRQGN